MGEKTFATTSRQAKELGLTAFYPVSGQNVVDIKGGKSGRRCRHNAESGHEIQCHNLATGGGPDPRCHAHGGQSHAARFEQATKQVAARRRATIDQFYLGGMPREIAKKAEDLANDPNASRVDRELTLQRLVLRQFLAKLARESEQNPDVYAEPNTMILIDKMNAGVARLAESKTKIETAERYVASPQALRNFVAKLNQGVRISMEEVVLELGESCDPAIIDAFASFWDKFLYQMQVLGQETQDHSGESTAMVEGPETDEEYPE